MSDIRNLPFEELRELYRAHISRMDFSSSTKTTILADTFYLYRHEGADTFWRAVASADFETEARNIVWNALRKHSTGDVNRLVNPYLSQLRRFRSFYYGGGAAGKSVAAIASSVAEKGETPYQTKPKTGTPDIPTPTPDEVQKYLGLWDNLDNYRCQEAALNKLFHELCPRNTAIEDILVKVATLNNFYATNIYSVYLVAKHILELDIDARLERGDITLVDDIKTVRLKGKEHNFYSFASKYCSHHNQTDFPIYDGYVDDVLRYFRNRDGFASFRNEELRDYRSFKGILLAFRRAYGLEAFGLKDIDRYLWQLGKHFFPRDYGQKKM